MASYNRVVLVGNMTRDAEIRYIQSGQAVTDIGLAVNDRRKDSNGNTIDETTFVDVTVWGRSAEVLAEYARKGSSVLIEGRLKLDTWETDGQKRSKLKVIADRVVLMGGRNNGPGDNPQQSWGGRGGYQQQGGFSNQGGYQQGGGYSNQGGGFPNQGFQQGPSGQGDYSQPVGGYSGGDGFDAPPASPASNPPNDDDIPF